MERLTCGIPTEATYEREVLTWEDVESAVESEVNLLCGLSGIRSTYSSCLAERLRSQILSKGLQTVVHLRPPTSRFERFFFGQGSACPEFLMALLGQTPGRPLDQDVRKGHLWAYVFKSPEDAVGDLPRHPAFSTGLPSHLRFGPRTCAVLLPAGEVVDSAAGRMAIVFTVWEGASRIPCGRSDLLPSLHKRFLSESDGRLISGETSAIKAAALRLASVAKSLAASGGEVAVDQTATALFRAAGAGQLLHRTPS